MFFWFQKVFLGYTTRISLAAPDMFLSCHVPLQWFLRCPQGRNTSYNDLIPVGPRPSESCSSSIPTVLTSAQGLSRAGLQAPVCENEEAPHLSPHQAFPILMPSPSLHLYTLMPLVPAAIWLKRSTCLEMEVKKSP